MANEIMAINGMRSVNESIYNEIKSIKLKTATNRIIKYTDGAKRNLFNIAVELKTIYDGKLYEDDGFSSIDDYTKQVFGYKKAMTYNLIKVADKYLIKDGNNVHSIMQREDNDYTISQLQECASIEANDAVELDANNVINPDMSTKEIRAAVKAFKNGGANETTNESETSDSANTATTNNSVKINRTDIVDALKTVVYKLNSINDKTAFECVDILNGMINNLNIGKVVNK